MGGDLLENGRFGRARELMHDHAGLPRVRNMQASERTRCGVRMRRRMHDVERGAEGLRKPKRATGGFGRLR